MTPSSIQVFRLDNSWGRERWSWEVTFADPGLNQEGYVESFARAQACINDAIENASREATP